jgi:hypothetical protein
VGRGVESSAMTDSDLERDERYAQKFSLKRPLTTALTKSEEHEAVLAELARMRDEVRDAALEEAAREADGHRGHPTCNVAIRIRELKGKP